MKSRGFFRRLATELLDDNVDDMAAMLTYYAIFALFPMLVFVLTMALLVVPADVVQDGVQLVAAPLPPSVANLIGEHIARLQETAAAGFAVGSALLAVWGASRGTAAMSTALNAIFQKKESRPWWKRQLIAIGVTLMVAALLVAALALLVVTPLVGHTVLDRIGLGGAFDAGWVVARWIGAGVLMVLLWTLVYRFVPDTDAPLRAFVPGAVVAVSLWIGISRACAFYFERFADYEPTYGALAGLIVFMFWLWLSNLTVLVGAEVNDVLADLRRDRSAAAAELAREEPGHPGEPGASGVPQPGLTQPLPSR